MLGSCSTKIYEYMWNVFRIFHLDFGSATNAEPHQISLLLPSPEATSTGDSYCNMSPMTLMGGGTFFIAGAQVIVKNL